MISACQTKVSTDIPAELLNDTKMQDMEATNFETFYSDSCRKNTIYRPQNYWFTMIPKTAIMIFRMALSCSGTILTGRSYPKCLAIIVKYFVNEKKMEASGNVVLVNSEGDTLKSEELKYNQAEDLIFSDQFISIKKEIRFFGNGRV